MTEYRRHYLPGGSFFFTVALADRTTTLLADEIARLREAVRTVRMELPFHIDAWVVLPEHMHAVWTLPRGDGNYSRRWQAIKTLFSKSLPRGERRSRSRENKGERGIWQRRFWEHTLQDERDYANHVDYVHFNPVKHGHVGRVADWPFSSFHRYVAAGVYPPDWGRDVVEVEMAGE